MRRTVTRLWLEAYRARQTIRLIERDRSLFEHLVDVAESNYTSALGTASQQDLVRAKLELTRLEDRLTVLAQRREVAQAQLQEWLPSTVDGDAVVQADQLPALSLRQPALADPAAAPDRQLYRNLLDHPRVRGLEQQIAASNTGVELARQSYKPQWGLNARYGYRDDDPVGEARSDFFSVGVSVDLPLFTDDRQDRQVAAAVAREEAAKTDRALLLRKLQSELRAARARLLQLGRRKALYEQRLLEEIHDQAEASLAAYTNDAGDFAEVVRARIAELNSRIDYLDITVDRLKTVATLNYFFAPAAGADSEGDTR